MHEKEKLRKQMKLKREALSLEEKSQMDISLSNRLFQLIQGADLHTLHTYLPMGVEVNIFPLIEKLLVLKKKIVCPQALPSRKMLNWTLQSLDQLEDGIYGTQYPANGQIYNGSYDLIIIPGLAFDIQGNRLGYGAGYYDTFLKEHPEAIKVGICYPFQIIDRVPVEAHDECLDQILF